MVKLPPQSGFKPEEAKDFSSHAFVEETFHCDAVQAHKSIVQRVWWDGGFPSIMYPIVASKHVKEATDDAGTHSIRGVPLGVLEEVTEAKLGEYINYSLKRMSFMALMLKKHRGRISLFPAGPGATRVVWEVLYTPTNSLGDAAFQGTIYSTFPMFLSYAKAHACPPKGRGLVSTLLILVLLAYLAFMVSRIMTIPKGPTYPGTEYMRTAARLREQTKELDYNIQRNVYLVIGGTGFTGSGIVQELRMRGAKGVKIMGRQLPPSVEYPYGPGKENRYPLPGVEYIRGDVTDKAALAKAMQGTNVVFHTAASYGSPSFSSQRGGATTELINVKGMQNIYEAAKAAGVSQIVYTSSCDTVFSALENLRANETHPFAAMGVHNQTYADGKFAVGDHYARTKILAERWLLEQDNKDYVRTVSVRPNGIFGPGEFSAFPKAINPGYILGMVPFYFDENQVSDWSCLYNLVYAHLLASHHLFENPYKVGGKAYFITDDENTNNAAWGIFKPGVEAVGASVKLWLKIPPWLMPIFGHWYETLHGIIKDTTGYDIPLLLTRKEAFKAIVSHTHDNARARADLGYQPLMSTAECQRYTAEEISRRYKMA